MKVSTIFTTTILLSILSGCIATSERLSEPNLLPSLRHSSSASWNDIHVGVTTQDEVRSLFGNPTDIQISSTGHVTSESWSYVSEHAARQPLQYLPFLGSLAIDTTTRQEPFAVSFSSVGIVDGLTVSRFQVQGSENDGRPSFDSRPTQPTYGTKNPYVQQGSLTRIQH